MYAKPVNLPGLPDEYQTFARRIRLIEEQDRAAALVEVGRALVRFPDRVDFHLKRCEILLNLGRNQSANACLAEVSLHFPNLDPDWSSVWSQLQRRASRQDPPPAPNRELSVASQTPALAPRLQLQQPTRQITQRWWFWTALGVGTTATALGLVLGLVPRPYERLEWQP